MAEAKPLTLAEKLQNDVEDFVAQLKPKKYEDGWPEDNWEEEMEKHPIFMSKAVGEDQELPPLAEALQKLKYDPEMNSPEELAMSYKEDGNYNFKLKKYRWAVDSYTQGLQLKCEDNELNAQLYTNRAAAHFHIGNFRKALKDATDAKTLKPDYLKAVRRGALSCWNLKLLEECLAWCEEGLKIEEEDSELQELKVKAAKEMKILERDRRKAAAVAARKKKESDLLRITIQERGIYLKDGDSLDLADLEPLHPALSGSKVHLNEDNCLVWPVMLLYPEYGVTDYIQQFHESSCLSDHLRTMFTVEDHPSWDKDHKYQSENLQIYFGYKNGLVCLEQDKPLNDIITDKRFKLHGGTPSFFVTVKDSPFDSIFRKKNRMNS